MSAILKCNILILLVEKSDEVPVHDLKVKKYLKVRRGQKLLNVYYQELIFWVMGS